MKETVITIRNDTFTAHIVLERLADMPLANIRKLFKLALTDWANRNEEACMVLEQYLEQAVDTTKEAWRAASIKYADNWKADWAGHHLTAMEKRNNKTLTTWLKAAKAAHTRAAKILTLYQEEKNRYG